MPVEYWLLFLFILVCGSAQNLKSIGSWCKGWWWEWMGDIRFPLSTVSGNFIFWHFTWFVTKKESRFLLITKRLGKCSYRIKMKSTAPAAPVVPSLQAEVFVCSLLLLTLGLLWSEERKADFIWKSSKSVIALSLSFTSLYQPPF